MKYAQSMLTGLLVLSCCLHVPALAWQDGEGREATKQEQRTERRARRAERAAKEGEPKQLGTDDRQRLRGKALREARGPKAKLKDRGSWLDEQPKRKARELTPEANERLRQRMKAKQSRNYVPPEQSGQAVRKSRLTPAADAAGEGIEPETLVEEAVTAEEEHIDAGDEPTRRSFRAPSGRITDARLRADTRTHLSRMARIERLRAIFIELGDAQRSASVEGLAELEAERFRIATATYRERLGGQLVDGLFDGLRARGLRLPTSRATPLVDPGE